MVKDMLTYYADLFCVCRDNSDLNQSTVSCWSVSFCSGFGSGSSGP